MMDPFAVLTGNILNSKSNNCPGYPMSVICNTEGGDPKIQNGVMAYPPFYPYIGRGDPSQGVGRLNPPHNPDTEPAFSSNPPGSQPNVPPTPCAGYPAGPLPRAPPLSYEEAVCHMPQPGNEHKLSAVQC